jgi:hypothetical protein
MCNLTGCSICLFVIMIEAEKIQKNVQHPQRKNTNDNFLLYYTGDNNNEQSKV